MYVMIFKNSLSVIIITYEIVIKPIVKMLKNMNIQNILMFNSYIK